MLKKILVATPLLACSHLLLQAQIISGKNEIGINVGALIYQGDLEPSALGSLKTPKPALGIYYNRILNDYFSVRANLVAGSIKGDESKHSYKAYRQQRNFNFSSPLKEISALAVFNPFGNNSSNGGARLTPYVFAGLGYSFLNIKRDWSKLNRTVFHPGSSVLTGLAIDSAHGTPKSIPVIPLGFGFKYALTGSLSLTAEYMYRKTFTDYLDGFSYSANSSRNDSYYTVSVGLVYNFGKNRLNCPVVK